MSRTNRPALRRKMGELYRRWGKVWESLNTALPIFPGVVYQLKTRCGKPRCLCQEGTLHTAWCLSYQDQGNKKLRSLSPGALESVGPLAQRYRKLRAGRAQMNRIFREMMGVFDRLERSLRVRPARVLAGLKRKGTRDASMGSV